MNSSGDKINLLLSNRKVDASVSEKHSPLVYLCQ